MKQFKKINPYILALAILTLILFITNYTPGTFLTGWDNIQTDLNPGLGIKRAFFGIWQEYQSFGLLAGMAHAADLVRSIIIWVMSLVVPQSMIRYIFHFGMVFVGAIGMFKLIHSSNIRHETTKQVQDDKIPFLGSLFYLFNHGSIQILFLPFEAFTIFFAMLPWLIWIFFQVIRYKSKRSDWFLFFLINLLAGPAFIAQQLFVVYILILGIISFGVLLKEISQSSFLTRLLRDDKGKTHEKPKHMSSRTLSSSKGRDPINIIKYSLISLILILAINSFWLIPQVYFLRTSSDVVQTAKMNQLATEDIFYNNLEKGTIQDFITMTGFFYDRQDMNQQPLFAPWKEYRSSPYMMAIMYILAFIPLLGILYPSKYRFPLLLIYPLILVALLNNTYPFTVLNDALRNNSFINQIFRSPFTKFIVPYSLVSSYFFAYGAMTLYKILTTVRLSKTVVPVSIMLIAVSVLPAFAGNYLSKEMRVTIPGEYLETIDYFDTLDKNKRIALLPDYTFWGWFFHSWGYNGSGFLWYGIEQPIISRTFDVWSTPSENYFWEIKTAIEAEDVEKTEAILHKYAVDYLIFDSSLIPVTSTTKALQYDRIESVLRKSDKITPIGIGEYLKVYEVHKDISSNNFVELVEVIPNIGPTFSLTNDDTAYMIHGLYQNDKTRPVDRYYPFIDLLSQTRHPDFKWSLSETENSFILTRELDINLDEYVPILPDNTTEVEIFKDNELIKYKTSFEARLHGEILTVEINKERLTSIPAENVIHTNCGKTAQTELIRESGTLSIESNNGAIACLSSNIPYLDQKSGYIFSIKNKNIEGRRLFVSISDNTKQQAYIEDRIQNDTALFVVPPRFNFGLGYNIAFQNNSLKNLPSKNILESVDVYLFPYEEIKNITFEKKDTAVSEASVQEVSNTIKHRYFLYTIDLSKIDNERERTIILNQAYHEGWKAYYVENTAQAYFPFIFGSMIDNHVKINGWANGWNLSTSSNRSDNLDEVKPVRLVAMIFWPQYLEFLGSGLLILAFIFLKRFPTK